jgi:hypothetical protein
VPLPSPQGTGRRLARLVGPKLHTAHQSTQHLAVLHVTWVPSGQHIGLSLLIEQPKDLFLVDLWAGVAGEDHSARLGPGMSVYGSRGKGAWTQDMKDLGGTCCLTWSSCRLGKNTFLRNCREGSSGDKPWGHCLAIFLQ